VIIAGLESVHTYGIEMLKNKVIAMVKGKKRDEKPVFYVRICLEIG
jgi:hypothetical protein